MYLCVVCVCNNIFTCSYVCVYLIEFKNMFIKYYANLTNVLFNTDLSPEFISAGIISIHEEEIIRNAPNSQEKAKKFLRIISSHIEISHTKSFISMLDIMERKGTMAIKELAIRIKSEL